MKPTDEQYIFAAKKLARQESAFVRHNAKVTRENLQGLKGALVECEPIWVSEEDALKVGELK